MNDPGTEGNDPNLDHDTGQQGQPPGDADLFEAYQNGDVDAFAQLVKRHEGPVYRFCLRALGQPEAAADATQEVFLRLVKNAGKWERKAKFTTWMYTIARNYCIDEARKGRFRKTESLDEQVGSDDQGTRTKLDQVESPTPDAERLVSARRLRAAVDSAIEELPPEQREVFCLRQYAGLSFVQIAKSIEVGENTVKSRMRYALQSVRNTLKNKGFDPYDTS